MSSGEIKQYQVSYVITMEDNATQGLEKLAQRAKEIATPLAQASEAVNKISIQFNSLKAQLETGITVAPVLNLKVLDEQLAKAKERAKIAADEIAATLGSALAGAKSKIGDTMVGQSTPELRKLLQDIENKTKNHLVNEKDAAGLTKQAEAIKRAIFARGETISEDTKKAAKIAEKEAKAAVKNAENITQKTTERLAPYQDLAKNSRKLNTVANAIAKIDKNINAFGNSKKRSVTIDANITPAVNKINTLLATIRESAAAIPVTIIDAGKAAKQAGKSISQAGLATKAGAANAKLASVEQPVTSMDEVLMGQQKLKDEERAKAKSKSKSKTTTPPALSASIEKMNALTAKLETMAKGKAIDLMVNFSDGGAVTKLTETVAKLQELANAKPLTLKVNFLRNGDEGFWLNQALTRLQELANTKPITLKAMFNGSDLGFQLNQCITKLQELANTKPITLKATMSETAVSAIAPVATAAANTGASESANGATAVASNGKKVTDPYRATQAEIAAAESHERSMSKMRLNLALEQAEFERAMAKKAHALRKDGLITAFGDSRTDAVNAKYNQAWEEFLAGMNKMRSELAAMQKDFVSEMRAKERAKRRADLWHALGGGYASGLDSDQEERVKNRAARHNRIERNRLNGYGATSKSAGQLASIPFEDDIYYSRGARGAGGNKSLYDRTKTRLYRLTGNTSFGSTTPMAVDMAKGMGTMFAIGGAMSAVGSSLHQSINYQNIMKTTEAILKNGTSNYSLSGFKDMEKVVRQVGKETKFTAPQVASAAKFLAMAGYDIPSIKSAITPIANLALIGDTNLGETSDKMTNVMTTFGIRPENMGDIADIMTSTFTRSNVDMMMLAESAKYAGGIAKMYGGNFKNNFSDTMALFGILGNSGIQASSAGTTIRMMYQNLMKPNKNATKAMQKYGIANRDSQGNPLEIVAIIKQLFDKVPKNKIADVVGDIFRITAQPGASTLIKAMEGGIDSPLYKLIQANRDAAGTDIAQSIANEKKNTLSGLWAQVESTFTEGILQAVENRQGGWAGMLTKIRDYLAKPETVQMLSNIVDLVEHLMSLMSEFAQVWANIYNLFPGLINGWMNVQLVLTQLGMLFRSIIGLMGVLDMFGLDFPKKAAAGKAAAVVGNEVKEGVAPFVGAGLVNGFLYKGQHLDFKKYKVGGVMPFHEYSGRATAVLEGAAPRRALAEQYRRKYENWGQIASYRRIPEAKRAEAKLKAELYLESYLMAKGMKPKFSENPTVVSAKTAWSKGISAGRAFGTINMASMVGSLKNMLISLIGGLAKAIGFLVSPIGLATAGLLAFGGSIAYLIKREKDRGETFKSNAEKYHVEAERLRQEDLKPAKALREKYLGKSEVVNITTNNYYYGSSKGGGGVKNDPLRGKYKDAFSSNQDYGDANQKWAGAIMSTQDARLGFKGASYSSIMQNIAPSLAVQAAMTPFADTYELENSDAAKKRAVSSFQYRGAIAESTIKARDKVIELKKQLMANKIKQDVFKKKALEILYSTAHVNSTNLLDANDYSVKELSTNTALSNPERFKQYQVGAYNAILAEIEGSMGSITGQLEAIEQLKSGVAMYSDNWWKAIGQILNGQKFAIEVCGQKVQGLLSMMPNGTIDVNSITAQIQNVVKGFEMTMQQLADITTAAYDILRKSGYIGKYFKDSRNFFWKQYEHLNLSKEDVGNYWDTMIGNGNPNATWRGKNREEYIKYIADSSNKGEAAKERMRIRRKGAYGAADAATKAYNNAQKLAGQNKNGGDTSNLASPNASTKGGILSGSTGAKGTGAKGTGAKGTGAKGTGAKGTGQKDYESKYNRSASRPTQVIINIDKLANFDRTSIAKGSDERAITSAIEVKIAEAVSMLTSQILTTASSTISQGLA